MWEGLTGRGVAKMMARMNRDAEYEAVEVLDPPPGACVLAIGAGAGVGLQALAERGDLGHVAGVDPSAVMVGEARRRVRHWVGEDLVEVVEARADRLPWPDRSFDAVVAVNSMQLWDPLDTSVAEVARVLRTGGRFVALTHDWAIERNSRGPVASWVELVTQTCARHGLVRASSWRARAEHGRSVAFSAERGEGAAGG